MSLLPLLLLWIISAVVVLMIGIREQSWKMRLIYVPAAWASGFAVAMAIVQHGFYVPR